MKLRSIIRIALMSALLAVCAWITIPFAVPFTMQTFGVFLALTVLGGVEGTIAVAVYIALGAIGIPVFSGFTGGFSALLGPTGGYILGFLAMGGVRIIFDKTVKNPKLEIPFDILGLLLCYLMGTVWFVTVMNGRGTAYTFGAALVTCVLPYILPDCAKLLLALLVGRRLLKSKLLTRKLNLPAANGRIESFETVKLSLSAMRYADRYEIVCNGDESSIAKYGFKRNDGDSTPSASVTCPTKEVLDVLNKCGVLGWDGFCGRHPRGVLDGTMFDFYASVNNGTEIHASGSQNFPPNFRTLRSFIEDKLRQD